MDLNMREQGEKLAFEVLCKYPDGSPVLDMIREAITRTRKETLLAAAGETHLRNGFWVITDIELRKMAEEER